MPMARVNGININYKVEGQGEPLVMLMGLSAALGAWSSQVPLLKKYYRVIRLDNRGAGKSDKPAGPYTTKMMADDTVGLMDHLGIEKANFMGVSMGGMIAQEIAINYPQRVNKLILASTYACNDNGPERRAGRLEQSSPPPEAVLHGHQTGQPGSRKVR